MILEAVFSALCILLVPGWDVDASLTFAGLLSALAWARCVHTLTLAGLGRGVVVEVAVLPWLVSTSDCAADVAGTEGKAGVV